MSNHLSYSASPYLLQHAENPVDWFPWCSEAFEKARREDKPIFLSIGYSTCHWCHVMAHESFEDKATAELLNRSFISIKVDREERPDIDSVYMAVCQAFTGSGGWPMSIFMNWEKKPFLAGTYFPPKPRYGMPGFSDLLRAVAKQWSSNRKELLRSADGIIARLQPSKPDEPKAGQKEIFEKAVQMFSESFDREYGGFGRAPKFPMPHNLLFLMLYAKQHQRKDILEMAEKTLIQMRKGGIFDHVGYGFSRYSTDRYFLAPHFEKMLYDNALLIIAYALGYAITQNPVYLDTAKKTAQYVIREMTSPDGGFYSAQDADSEGVEGKYYTFTLEEIFTVLGKKEGKRFSESFDVTASGNFDGTNILNLLTSNDLDSDYSQSLEKLYNYRKNRSKLHLDDKILLSWNSMMIAAMAVLYRVSGEEKYLQAAMDAQEFIERNLSEGLRLFTSWREGKHAEHGFLDDYVFYAAALTELYHSTLNKEYLEKAEQFCLEAAERFADKKNGGFYLSDSKSTELFMNPKESYDGAIPSGNSVMLYVLVRLHQLTEKVNYQELVQKQMQYLSGQAQEYLTGHSMFLLAKWIEDYPPEHVVIALKDPSDLENKKEKLPLFGNVIVVSESKTYPLIHGRTTFYCCKDHICYAPKNTL